MAAKKSDKMPLPPSPPPSPLVGLVAVPLVLVAVSLYLVRGGVVFSSPSAPYELLQAPPSPTHALSWLQWTTPPRDLTIVIGLERLALSFLVSGALLFVLNLLSPNRNRPVPRDPAVNVDPRKVDSTATAPYIWVLASAAIHIFAMRVLALRSAPGYAERLDARANLGKKANGPPFEDVGAMASGLLTLLIGFRELGNVGDRITEIFNVKAHRNIAQVGHILTGAARFIFAVAVFRVCVVPPSPPM